MAVSYMRLACRLALFGELEEEKIPGKKSYRGSPAEDGGFEPPRACTQHAFQACAIGH